MLLCVEILQASPQLRAGFQWGVKPFGHDGKKISTSFERDLAEVLNYYNKFGIGEATEMLNCKIYSLFLPTEELQVVTSTELTPIRLPPHLVLQ